ncbi:ABC transporter ATP-binding protein [Vibrio alfacsensis]|uniref:ABC transporter ATP-binding protein n=1 Tax=Vibrio alfacsensis TaxID=1074311 RepID=UPI001BF0F07F|nr:sn-glycerol-3-phosphate ABC transporter ATP-binding protein UgpC [Vibrio alfacsensis]BCN24593.1 ABC transporter ATP-binding protein [Vibrio alfacsensis]
MADVKLNKIVKRYGKIQTIHNIDLTIDSGEFVVFVGPSGCGKSTLLRMIAGLEDITEGELYIDKELVNDCDPASRKIAMVFQSYALYPHMTVAENMGFGLKMTGHPKQEIEDLVHRAAKTLQLEALLDRTPKQLSGGQRQRVAIGRAIVREPKVFLFDEPLSNLDAELRVEMRLQIARLHQDMGNTMIYVTHDQVEAMTLADKIVVLNKGRIEQVGSPLELYHRPINLFVAGFIGSPKMNFLPGTIQSLDNNQITVQINRGETITVNQHLANLSVGQNITLGIRPEHLKTECDGDVHFVIQNEVSERLGNATYMFGNFAGVSDFKVHLTGDIDLQAYSDVKLTCQSHDCHFFDENGLRIE